MADEEQLASLGLLLRQPIATSSHAPNDATSELLQRALEDDDCRLIGFVGRLINSYTTCSTEECNDNDGVRYTLLRLGVRILLMRYSRYATDRIIDTDTSDDVVFDGGILDWECCLVQSLLEATAVNIGKKHQYSLGDVDVEMAWSTVGILMRWSHQTTGRKATVDESDANQKMADLWVQSIHALMRCHDQSQVKSFECPSTM